MRNKKFFIIYRLKIYELKFDKDRFPKSLWPYFLEDSILKNVYESRNCSFNFKLIHWGGQIGTGWIGTRFFWLALHSIISENGPIAKNFTNLWNLNSQ